jgi:fermentation-respiration switch protein FrsA (DUF1100 family)
MLLHKLVWALEARLVYPGAFTPKHPFPQHTSPTPADFGLRYREVTLESEDGVSLPAWAMPNTSPRWLVYFHGNGHGISSYLPVAAGLHHLGLNVLLPEYRGFGGSVLTPSEGGLYCDADASYAYLRERSVSPRDILLYGFSLGSGVAIDLASRAEVGGLIVEAGYTSLPEVARARFPFAPRKLMKNAFASSLKIARVRAPTLFLHALADPVVPFWQGRQLFETATAEKRFVTLKNGHNAMFDPEVRARAMREVSSFLEEIQD